MGILSHSGPSVRCGVAFSFLSERQSWRQRGEILHLSVHIPKQPHRPELGWSKVGSQELCLGIPHGCRGSRHLGNALQLSLAHEQGTGSEVEQPGLEQVPIWNVSITGGALAWYMMAQALWSDSFLWFWIWIFLMTNEIAFSPLCTNLPSVYLGQNICSNHHLKRYPLAANWIKRMCVYILLSPKKE